MPYGSHRRVMYRLPASESHGSAEPHAPATFGKERLLTPSILVLVVDDETLIQELLEQALTDAGFAVVKANDGEEAISRLEAEGADFRALVSDINLGFGPTGWDVAKRARELNEHLAVVYMTGGSGHEWASLGVPNSIMIAKPFAPAQVVTAVAQLLNGLQT